jgi:hypothetical protein
MNTYTRGMNRNLKVICISYNEAKEKLIAYNERFPQIFVPVMYTVIYTDKIVSLPIINSHL